jgi:hypothetical protein
MTKSRHTDADTATGADTATDADTDTAPVAGTDAGSEPAYLTRYSLSASRAT